MLRFKEIKKAVNRLLKRKYPDVKIYGNDVKEGYQTPSFFVELINKGSTSETKNFASGGFTIKITYFQDKKDELDQLEKVDEIKDLFGLFFCVEDRKLTIGEFSHDYIGEYQDLLQISIEIDYKENTQRTDTAPIARGIGIKVTQG